MTKAKVEFSISQLKNSIDYEYNSTVLAIAGGDFPRELLTNLGIQFYLQNREPSHIAYLYSNLPSEVLGDRRLIEYVIEIIQEEELGINSNNIRHADLVLQFLAFFGIQHSDIEIRLPNPENAILLDWLERSRFDRPWLECLAIQVALEDDARAMRLMVTGLEKYYSIPTNNLMFWKVHGSEVEERHASLGYALLERYVNDTNCRRVCLAFDNPRRLFNSFLTSLYGTKSSKIHSPKRVTTDGALFENRFD